jgi:hypothetical protein
MPDGPERDAAVAADEAKLQYALVEQTRILGAKAEGGEKGCAS